MVHSPQATGWVGGMAMVFHGDHIRSGQCLRKQLMTLETRTSLTLGLQLATELANVTNTWSHAWKCIECIYIEWSHIQLQIILNLHELAWSCMGFSLIHSFYQSLFPDTCYLAPPKKVTCDGGLPPGKQVRPGSQVEPVNNKGWKSSVFCGYRSACNCLFTEKEHTKRSEQVILKWS